jgi:hypothetical protein
MRDHRSGALLDGISPRRIGTNSFLPSRASTVFIGVVGDVVARMQVRGRRRQPIVRVDFAPGVSKREPSAHRRLYFAFGRRRGEVPLGAFDGYTTAAGLRFAWHLKVHPYAALRLRLSNNAAERAVSCIAVGRKDWTFAGSDERRAAAIYTLIDTAKLNDVGPQAWLADVLARLPNHPAKRIAELLPWKWQPRDRAAKPA